MSSLKCQLTPTPRLPPRFVTRPSLIDIIPTGRSPFRRSQSWRRQETPDADTPLRRFADSRKTTPQQGFDTPSDVIMSRQRHEIATSRLRFSQPAAGRAAVQRSRGYASMPTRNEGRSGWR